ncbi:uncharacterized protein LAESUDRAFT_649164 [Laetiporus sulphureus 93-53]|uniref:Uncharacterized protein n=1 Tax=Laetiporus sulphureus 93-53 TaxID=1314785 RepID=A0A165F3C4_9APHY|nr:uncharacterized protein LAESUDRAFT_649164 [Laetiporus sulphureus 93-53]KZT08291.1 hypothetical protein LAESUDRAFT_649164 [Laetiporus sulphureus 93-53]
MNVEIPSHAALNKQLFQLRQHLEHLPEDIPIGNCYDFKGYAPSEDAITDYGSAAAAFNHDLEVIFAPKGRTEYPIIFHQRGEGLTAVVNALRKHIFSDPMNAVLRKWVADLLDAARAHCCVSEF